ncbi:MAG: CDC27 family protein [Bacteroidales bacterium]|nr:CDC27 family protein [Bacteroidales bacterium]
MSKSYIPFNDFFNEDDDDSFLDYDAMLTQIEEHVANDNFVYFDPEELTQCIDFFLNIDEFDNAELINEYALRLFKDDTTFFLLKAELLIIRKNFEQAISILDSIEQLEPYNSRIYILKSSAFLEQDLPDKAISEFHRALYNEVDDPSAIYDELAYCYLSLKNYKDAIKSYKKCIEIDNDNVDAYFYLTEIFIKSENTSDGIFYFENLINLNYQNVNALLSIGKLFEHEMLYQNALNAYNKVLKIDEEHFDAISFKINIYKTISDYESVIRLYNKYNELFYPFFKEELAKTYEELGRIDEALEIYTNLHNEDQEDLNAIVGIANCYFLLENFVKSEKFINKGFKLFEDYTELKILKARILFSKGEMQEAFILIERIMKNFSMSIFSENEFKFAELLIEMKQYHRAIEFLSSFINSDAFNARLYFLLAAAHYNNFSYQEAYNAFENAISFSCYGYSDFFNNCLIAHTDDYFYDIIENCKKK